MDKDAKLTVRLYAGETKVRESDDPILWNMVLTSIIKKQNAESAEMYTPTEDLIPQKQLISIESFSTDDPVYKFAEKLGIEADIVKGACAPSIIDPYLMLDSHAWEAFKKNCPKGTKSIGPLAMSLSLLCYWFPIAELGTPTKAMGQRVLGTIGLSDNNPTRSVNNCRWLQVRPQGIIINPAEVSRAKEAVKAFCTQDWSKW